MTHQIPVRCPIKLGQFLKLSGLVEDGCEAAVAISAGDVRVNGQIERRRGRRLNAGDCIILGLPSGPVELRVSQASSPHSEQVPQ